jgi:chitodextrinase
VTVVEKLDPPKGKPPVGGIAAWDNTKVYLKGDKVSFNKAIYTAKWWTQGDQPKADGGPWTLVK